MLKSIGDYFKRARIGASATLEEAATHSSLISVDELRALEAGLFRPSLDTLFSLVNSYNLDPDEFIELLYRLSSSTDDTASTNHRIQKS